MGAMGILEMAIGLVFIYFLVSMLCSAVVEFAAAYFGRRGAFLREGMINLLRDRWFYLRVINHPLVTSLYRNVPGKPRTPSYIPAKNFADTLLDVLVLKASELDADLKQKLATDGRSAKDVQAAARTCAAYGYTVGDALLPLIDSANGSLDEIRKNLEQWYESGMDRVSGWYKKYTRQLLFIVGLLVAIAFNVDTFEIANQLATSPALRASLANAADQMIASGKYADAKLPQNDQDAQKSAAEIKKFASSLAQFEKQGLPLGFSCLEEASGLDGTVKACWDKSRKASNGEWLHKLGGWLVTGIAISFGAPFWFDLLNRLVDLRAAGKKPPAGSKTEQS